MRRRVVISERDLANLSDEKLILYRVVMHALRQHRAVTNYPDYAGGGMVYEWDEPDGGDTHEGHQLDSQGRNHSPRPALPRAE